MCITGCQGKIVDCEVGDPCSLFVDMEVLWQVAGMMSQGISRAVLFAARVEVTARAPEVGHFAERILVDVDGMLSGCKPLDLKLNVEFSTHGLAKGGDPNMLSVIVVQNNLKRRRLSMDNDWRNKDEQCGKAAKRR